MHVATKIMIGMLVGAALGVTLGPRSWWLARDTFEVRDFTAVELRSDPSQPSSRIELQPGLGAQRLPFLRWATDDELDGSGTPHEAHWALVDVSHMSPNTWLLGDSPPPHQAWLRVERGHGRPESFSVPSRVSGFGLVFVDVVEPLGTLFLRLIYMVIVPLVFSSLVVGMARMGDVRRVGRLGSRTLLLYLATTAVAIVVGMALAVLLCPGDVLSPDTRMTLQATFARGPSDTVIEASATSFVQQLVQWVPTNPIAALAEGNMLSVLVFAMFFGLGLAALPEASAGPVVRLLDGVQHAMIQVINGIMRFAPVGVTALVAVTLGQTGIEVLGALALYVVTVLLGFALHVAVVYGAVLRFVARTPVLSFIKACLPAQLVAFSTSSSAATLPVSMRVAEQSLNVSPSVASFVLPLGATMNMDGTALFQGVSALFIAQAFGIELSFASQAGIVGAAVVASIGTAGAPASGVVVLALVLEQAGLPGAGIGLILGVERLVDMFRTAVNVTGDLVVTAAVARSHHERPSVS